MTRIADLTKPQSSLLWVVMLLATPAWAEPVSPCDSGSQDNPPSVKAAEIALATANLVSPYGPEGGTKSCAKDPSDPYDPAYKITYGKYDGQCIDSSTVRPPVVLGQDDKQITIANFYHDGKFWVARIPKGAVASVEFQGVPFGSKLLGLVQLKHGQFRFTLNQPIELREQAGSQSATVMLGDLIVSSTATHPHGVAYSPLQGKNFGIATRVLSPTARGVEEISEDASRVHQYELKFDLRSPNARSEFLINAITDGAAAGYKDMYNLLNHNCTTVLFDSLDKTVARGDKTKPFRGHLWQIHDEIENPSLKALKKRHIGVSRVQDMNDEMSCAKPGASVGGVVVSAGNVGAASALCRFNAPSR